MADFTFHVSQPVVATVQGILLATGKPAPFAAGVIPVWTFDPSDSTITTVVAPDGMSATITPTVPTTVTITETPTGLAMVSKSVEFTADFADGSTLTVTPIPPVATGSTLTVNPV